MLRHDFDERLEFGVVLAVVAGLVRVRDHHHVAGVVVIAQALVQPGESAVFLGGDAGALEWASKQDVVVAALEVADGPFVADEGDEVSVPGWSSARCH